MVGMHQMVLEIVVACKGWFLYVVKYENNTLFSYAKISASQLK